MLPTQGVTEYIETFLDEPIRSSVSTASFSERQRDAAAVPCRGFSARLDDRSRALVLNYQSALSGYCAPPDVGKLQLQGPPGGVSESP